MSAKSNSALEARMIILKRDATKNLNEADKLAKTTLLRWKPDWEGAANLYDKAALDFQNAKDLEKAKECFIKAAEAHYQSDAVHTAAQQMEKAALVAVEMGENDEAVQLFERAVAFFTETGNTDKATAVLIKASKQMETSNPERAAELLLNACTMYEEQDRVIFAMECFKATVALLIRLNRNADAIDVMNRQVANFRKLNQQENLWKAFLGIVVMHLHNGDYVAADRAYQEHLGEDGYLRTPEATVANEMLEAYDQGDDEAMQAATKKQVLNFLDQQVARVAKKLHAPGGRGAAGGDDEGGAGAEPENDLL